MLKFITTIEGQACLMVIGLIIAGGINEFIYFRSLCKRTIKGYDDLAEDYKELFK